jgi:hypothetical protein
VDCEYIQLLTEGKFPFNNRRTAQATQSMFEHRTHPLLPRRHFARRLAQHSSLALLLIGASWLLGTLGYHFIADLPWIDSLMNAAMILGGMGPVDTLHSTASKLFASIYALYCGVIFLAASAIVVAPLAHRMLHRLHLDSSSEHSRKS